MPQPAGFGGGIEVSGNGSITNVTFSGNTSGTDGILKQGNTSAAVQVPLSRMGTVSPFISSQPQ